MIITWTNRARTADARPAGAESPATDLDANIDDNDHFAESVDGTPRWGKMHNRNADDLRPACEKLDLGRVFGNEYLNRVLGSQ